MYICMYVGNGFTIETYEFTHSLHTFLTCPAQMYGFTHCLRTFLARTTHGAIAMEDLEDSEKRQAKEIEDG